jgi:hypothetical protein
MKSKGGSVNIGGKWNPPSWVPTYPGATMTASASSQNAEGDGGAGYFETNDSLEKVLDYYERELKGEDMQVTRNVFSPDGKNTMGSLAADDDSNKRYVNVNYGVSPKGNTVHVVYSTKK